MTSFTLSSNTMCSYYNLHVTKEEMKVLRLKISPKSHRWSAWRPRPKLKTLDNLVNDPLASLSEFLIASNWKGPWTEGDSLTGCFRECRRAGDPGLGWAPSPPVLIVMLAYWCAQPCTLGPGHGHSCQPRGHCFPGAPSSAGSASPAPWLPPKRVPISWITSPESGLGSCCWWWRPG